jgi:hypothetical protein
LVCSHFAHLLKEQTDALSFHFLFDIDFVRFQAE